MAGAHGAAGVRSFVVLAGLAAGVAVASNAMGSSEARTELHPAATIAIDGAQGTPILAADGGRIAAAANDAGPVAWNPATGETRDVGICDTETIEVARASNQVASIC